MDAAPILRVEELVVRYGSFVAVNGLNLELRRGELFGLLGPNGAGKSTTLRVLIGQLRPSSGRVTVAGHEVVRDWDLVKPLFGYVPDRENHFEEFTRLHNLQFFPRLYQATEQPVQECLHLGELSDAANLPWRAYF